MWILLRQQSPQARLDVIGFITGGQTDRDERTPFRQASLRFAVVTQIADNQPEEGEQYQGHRQLVKDHSRFAFRIQQRQRWARSISLARRAELSICMALLSPPVTNAVRFMVI